MRQKLCCKHNNFLKLQLHYYICAHKRVRVMHCHDRNKLNISGAVGDRGLTWILHIEHSRPVMVVLPAVAMPLNVISDPKKTH